FVGAGHMRYTHIAIVFFALSASQPRATSAYLVYNRYTSSPSLLLPEVAAIFDSAMRAPRSSVHGLQDEDDVVQLSVLKRKFLRRKIDGYLKRPKSSYIRFG
ncbi:hypothetical protein AAVH_33287, partial [Aphelenchoides avenae]